MLEDAQGTVPEERARVAFLGGLVFGCLRSDVEAHAPGRDVALDDLGSGVGSDALGDDVIDGQEEFDAHKKRLLGLM